MSETPIGGIAYLIPQHVRKLDAALAERDAEIDRLKLQVSAAKHNIKVTQAAFDEDEAVIKERDEEIRLLKACIFSCLQSDSYEYIKERMELEEKRWEKT